MKETSRGYKIFQAFNVLVMIMMGVITLFPYIHVMAKAFNDGLDTAMGGITIFPRIPTLENFQTILSDPEIYQAARVTLMKVLIGTILALIVQFGAAYGLRKKNLKGRMAILTFLMIPMFLSGGLIPTYILYSRIGLLNNFLVYVIPGLFSFYNMIIIRTYMNSAIPDSLEESAKIDGANEIFIFFKIILPLSIPILATITLWVAVAEWNSWTDTLYFVTNPRLHTLQYKLMQIVKESERIIKMMQIAAERGEDISQMAEQLKVTPESLMSAQIVVTTIPIILVYPFLQKYFIKGVMIGAVKE